MDDRFGYVKYDDESMQMQAGMKTTVEFLAEGINLLNSERHKALALTKLEECYMWIGKAIRDDQLARQALK